MAERKEIEYNWYEILGLEYYPKPEENIEKIKSKIEEKRKEWLRKETDPLNGTKFKTYGELIKRGVVEDEMLNGTRRKELIEDAQKKLFEPIDKFLKYFEGSIITTEKIKEIASKTKRKEELIRKRIEENNKIELYDEKIYKKYCENINKKFEFLTVDQNLKILDKQDLYSFLSSENINVARLNERQIVEELNEKRKKLIKSDNETSAKKKLYTECEKIFGNRGKRNEYDDYLKYLKYVKVRKELEEIKAVYEITDKTISNEKSDNFNNIKNILKSENEAKNIFIGFCEENKIPYDISSSSTKAGKTNENNNEELQKLSEMACNNAVNAMNQHKFDEALRFLEKAKSYWPENIRIKIIENQLKEKLEASTNSTRNTRQNYNNYNNNSNYNNTNSASSNNVILIIIGIILFIIMIFMMSLTMKNLSANSNSHTQSTSKTQSVNTASPMTDSNTESSQTTNTTIEQPAVDDTHETINGYTYLKNNGQSSSFSKRSLGYEESIIGQGGLQSSGYESAKVAYCNAVNEIEKVDRGIVPGTSKSFSEAVYTEVDDAYKEYLQEIAQIRQIVLLLTNGNDSVLEPEAGCFYKGTHWNNANSQYKAKQFYNSQIDNYYNTYGN